MPDRLREVICTGCGHGIPATHAGDHYWIQPHDCERERQPITRIGSVVVDATGTQLDGWGFSGGLVAGWSMPELVSIATDLAELRAVPGSSQ